MKNRWKSLTWILSGILAFSCALSACGTPMDPVTQSLQGEWADVNSSAVLEISGRTLRIQTGSWSEKFPFEIRNANGTNYIVSPEGSYGFEMMSEIRIGEDGALTAYEMVLDGDSREFRFVRREDLEKEKEIVDLSEDAPKTIESRDIEMFSLTFSVSARHSYDLGDEWPHGRYSWTIDKDGDGSYEMQFSISGPSYIIAQFSDTVTEEYIRGLADLIAQENIAANNGYYRKNNVDADDYSLYVDYASGENLVIRAEGDAADTCVLPLESLLAYAAQQDIMPEGY